MVAANIRIIREEVIRLLRISGYGVVEAVDKWDKVYSQQYLRAAPNVTHTWLIGDYEIEFTKLVDQVEADAYDPIGPDVFLAGINWIAWITALGLLALVTVALLAIG